MSLLESIDEWAAQISFTLFLLFDFVDPHALGGNIT